MVFKSLDGLVPKYLLNIFSRNSTRDSVYLRNSETEATFTLHRRADSTGAKVHQ